MTQKYVLWIDTNCGFSEPDWEINNNLQQDETLEEILAHAETVLKTGIPVAICKPGTTPRADGLFSNPETD